MVRWVLRVEGVNFDATVDDTNDLSTTRGASLALLRLDRAVAQALGGLQSAPKPLYSGASQCAFVLDTDEAGAEAARRRVEDALRRPGGGKEPFPHLTFVVDVAAGDATDAALDRAEARNHARQFRRWTVAPQPFAASDDADPLETVRPGTEDSWLPPGKVLRIDEPVNTAARSKREVLSRSVKHRRDFGRAERQRFYRDELDPEVADGILGPVATGLSFTNTFGDIVADAPKDVPVSLRSKVAVFYADGNQFGKIRKSVPIGTFSDHLRDKRRALLEAILRWYAIGAEGNHREGFAVADDDGRRGLRFETLLWGGDECLFVLPAWLALPFVAGFFKATAGWEIGGHDLTHAAGVAIAHHKTPIRQLKRIAKTAADLAKGAGLKNCDTVTFDIYESLAPPDTDLGPARARLFGMPPSWEDGHARLAEQLALPGARFDAVMDNLRILAKGEGGEPFPRSQLYGTLRAARAAGDLTGDKAADAVTAYLDFFARRPDGKAHRATLDAHLLPACDGVARARAIDLALIAQFWDYADPLGGRVAAFGTEGGR